ncbi:MAG: serine/threonine protein kinase [Chloroflexi bacterium]|nr:serine/threonine protein kinase [Chloroflexota bacterium]
MAEKIADDPLIGTQLNNYRIDSVLGRGGMAVVYAGWDIKLNRRVALKVIDARFRDKPSYAERFIRESQVVATWDHPNIIKIYYADDAGGLYYFAMQHIDGLDLRQLMDEYHEAGQLFPLDDMIRIGYFVASAIDYAHDHQVIHRDIKPSNVMVSSENKVLLMDFGLALEVNQGSMGQVFGTPHYMAPEQAKASANALPQSDIYSLGVLFYEMLTGTVPFDDPSPTSVAIQHIQNTPPPPRSINPKLNATTEGVLLKALEKSPTDRYQTATELVQALEKALAEGAEQYDPDALPPPPATVQRPLPISDPRRVMTVSERVALHLQTRTPAPTEADPAPGVPIELPVVEPAAPITAAPAPTPWYSGRGGWLGGGLILLLLAGVVWGGGLFAQGSVTPTATATTAVVAAVTLETPTLAPSPTRTPSPEATATQTVVPTETPSPTATEPPPTTAVVATETAVPTTTLAPSATPTPTPEPAPSLILSYNRTGFYIYNTTDTTIDLTSLTFNALTDEQNSTTYAFQARTDWPFQNLAPAFCGAIELLNVDTTATRPSRCKGYGMVTFPGQDAEQYFWVRRPDENITQFRVAWLGETIKICQMIDGFCTVSLP